MNKIHHYNCISSVFFVYQLVLTVFLLWSMQACVPEQENDIKKVFPLDPLVGDWQGTQKFSDGNEMPLAAQVIAYKDGRYQANLLRRFDVSETALAILEGKGGEEKISFSSKSMDGINWEGRIENSKFSGKYYGEKNGQFMMEKVERLSPNLDKLPTENALILFDGTNLDNWEHQKDATGYINLARFINAEHCSAYLLTEIWSDKPIEAVLHLGSNDGIKAWLNDKEIVSHNISRGAAPGQEKVSVQLDEGWNILMLRITNAGGSWGAFARFFDQAGNILRTISERDWTNEVSRVSKSLEDNDSYLMNWKVAGPYKKEGMGAEQLFEISFQPERNDKSNVEWKIIDFTQVDYSPKWKVKNNCMEVLPGSGSIVTRQKFKDFRLHIEFRSPFMPRATSQARGNSGVYLQGLYEVQVLDSYGLSGEDNECGGIYRVAKPDVNMCAPPGQWQTYDIIFTAPRFNKQGEKITNARLTVDHNGILIHNDIEVPGPTGGAMDSNINLPGGIMLQDHGDLVQYRNIWLVESSD